MSARIVPFLYASTLNGKAKYPIRFAVNATSTFPAAEIYMPGHGGANGDPYVVHVDFYGGDDIAASAAGPATSILHPYSTLYVAWMDVVAQANLDPTKLYIIHLHNVTPGTTLINTTAITTLPIYGNIVIRGDGKDSTVFSVTNDVLLFEAGNGDQQYTLRFQDLTLYGIELKAQNISGGSLVAGCRILGNGTTGIIGGITVRARDGGAGATSYSGSTAGDGTEGGYLAKMLVSGFWAAGTFGSAELRLLGGNGGAGGDIYPYSGGEYGDEESYGSGGNGGANGQVTGIRVEDMRANASPTYDTSIKFGGWICRLVPGLAGLPSTRIGGSLGGTTAGSSGDQRSSTSYPQTIVIMRSEIATFTSFLEGTAINPYAMLTLVDCIVGMSNAIGRQLAAYSYISAFSVLHPSLGISTVGTNDTSTSTSLALDMA